MFVPCSRGISGLMCFVVTNGVNVQIAAGLIRRARAVDGSREDSATVLWLFPREVFRQCRAHA